MRTSTVVVFVLIALQALCPALTAQEEPSALEEAAAAVASGNWASAAELYESAIQAEPENAQAWFGLGRSHFETRRVDRAIGAFEKALELGFEPARVMLHLARCHAAQGSDEAALEWIGKAAETGAGIHRALEGTEEFKRFQDHPEFTAILDRVRPCNSPAHRQLDFWIGNWRVLDAASEQQVGTNSIIKILNGCGVIENWSSGIGGEGKSLFYLSNDEKTWKQVWLTDAAGQKEKHLIAVVNGAVRFQGELRLDDGRIVLDRTTLVPESENRVRQVIQQSADGGETWQTGFDAIYIRIGSEDDSG